MPITVSGNVVDVDGTQYWVRELCGQGGNIGSAERKHRLKFEGWLYEDGGTFSLTELYQAVLAYAPSTFDNCAANYIDWAEDEGTDHWLFNVDYTSAVPESTLRWSFDTSGGTFKLTTSRATTRYAISGRTAPDFKNAIGVKNGEPEGVDIVIPALKLTATYKWPANVIDTAYVRSIARLTGGVNNATWYGFNAGELLFLGASGEVVPGQPTEITYNYAASENVTGLSIGTIAGVAKKGHEYLWVLFEANDDTSAKKLVQRPLAAYVESVYKTIDYSTFGIGS